MKKFISFIISFMLFINICTPAFAEDKIEAITIRLKKTEGDGVSVLTNSGKSMKLINNMRIFTGYNVKTDKSSYAFLSLDDEKAIKLDKNTDVQIKKSGKKNEILLSSGQLFFNVSKKLEEDENMNVITSNIIMGVRGTSGSVTRSTVTDYKGITKYVHTVIQLYDGKSEIEIVDTDTGKNLTYILPAGSQLVIDDYAEKNADKIELLTISANDIAYFAAAEIINDKELADRIYKDTGISLEDIKNALPAILEKENDSEKNKQNKIEKSKDAIEELINQPPSTGSAGGNDTIYDTEQPEPPQPEEPEPPQPENSAQTEQELIALISDATKSNIEIPVGANITLNSAQSIPSHQTLTINGSLKLSADLTVNGILKNNSINTLDLTTNNVLISDGAEFDNNGRIISADGKIIINGNSRMINNAEMIVPAVFIEQGALNITNNGTIESILGKPGTMVTFNTTDITASSLNGMSAEMGSEARNEYRQPIADIEFNKVYYFNSDGSWSPKLPQVLEASEFASSSTSADIILTEALNLYDIVTINFKNETLYTDLQQNLSVPNGKKLIIEGSANSGLRLDNGAILTNNGTVEVIGGASISEVAASAANRGNIINNGLINVINGALSLNDATELESPLLGTVSIGTLGTLKVASSDNSSISYGNVGASVTFENGGTIDLVNDGTDKFLNILDSGSLNGNYILNMFNNLNGGIVKSNALVSLGLYGDGTQANPYLITSSGQLKKLSDYINSADINYTANKFYKQIVDINLNSYAEYGWIPIGNSVQAFDGIFDGNGCVISNLEINTASESETYGLFGNVSGIIQNITLENVNISATSATGAISGNCTETAIIENCAVVSGKISSANNVGGIVGNALGNIKNCYNLAEVRGNTNVGGIAGNVSGNINNCYSTANITAYGNAGGIAGSIFDDGDYNISNCVFLGQSITVDASNILKSGRISGTDFTGSTVSDENNNYNNNYSWNITEINGLVLIDGNRNGKGISYAAQFDMNPWIGWDSSIWSYITQNNIPILVKASSGVQSNSLPAHITAGETLADKNVAIFDETSFLYAVNNSEIKNIEVPLGISIVLAAIEPTILNADKKLIVNGSFSINGGNSTDLEIYGVVENNGTLEIARTYGTMHFLHNSKFINNGDIVIGNNGVIQSWGNVIIENGSGKIIPSLYVNLENLYTSDTGITQITNNGTITSLFGANGAKVKFANTGVTSTVLNGANSDSSISIVGEFEESVTDVEFERIYTCSTENNVVWKLNTPQILEASKISENMLDFSFIIAEALEFYDTVTLNFGNGILYADLVNSLTIPSGKTLIIGGSMGDGIRLDGITLTNNGTIEINDGSSLSEVALSTETRGNIINNGTINVNNGNLTINDATDLDTPLGGTTNIKSLGILRVPSYSNSGIFYGNLNGTLSFENGGILKLSGSGSTQIFTILQGGQILGTYQLDSDETNNPGGGVVDKNIP